MREINVVVPLQTPEEMIVTQNQEILSNGKLIAEAKITMD
jgi:hypothetical protein